MEDEGEMEDRHLVTDECGHWTVRRLLALASKYSNAEDVCFADMLLDAVPTSQLFEWAETNRGCFVLCSLVESSRQEVMERAIQLLTLLIDQLVANSVSHDGGRVLLNALKTHTHHKQ